MATPTTTGFELEGADGLPLRGEYRTAEGGEGRPAVVICHGFKGFKDWGFFPHLAARLANAGLSAVSFNFSGSGVGPDGESFSEPERFGHATFSGDLRDIETVFSALEHGGLGEKPGLARPTKIGLFGHSRGGGTAVLYAASAASVGAQVTWAAIASVNRWDTKTRRLWRKQGRIDVVNARTGDVLPLYTGALDEAEQQGSGKLDILHAAARIKVPWLIIHGEQDESVSVEEGKKLHEAANKDQTKLEVVAGVGHTFGARHPWAGSTPEMTRVMDATVRWFARHLF
jgi:dienelactone hydrolase